MERLDVVHRGGSVHLRRSRLTAVERGEHGTLARYQTGCRCARCRRARAAYDRVWRAVEQVRRRGEVNRRVPVERAAVALNALRAEGRTVAEIAAEVGCSAQTLRRVARGGGRVWSTFESELLKLAAR